MSLRLNLAIGALSSFGLVAVCTVSAARLDYAPDPAQARQAPVAAVAVDEPAATGAIAPVAAVPAKPAAKPARAKAEAKPETGLDSERLAALLSSAPIGTVKPARRP
ncbi:hypothetical protein [Methylobacterium oryzihabitans]|uniref:Uncharacterized protein n=1 Tax=Methylobacterium oryzihabitans TaxID=2499852 RepID=A0A3S2YVJ4_9HYPH|nr:hypothetical protein [Methylobacterium oryzihabitans]RVU20214.1 hypothetical protein EOE48_06300 [Methylobacterium oryzihabitans]